MNEQPAGNGAETSPLHYPLPRRLWWFAKKHCADFIHAHKISRAQMASRPTRTEIINYLLSLAPAPTRYLEIGVRNPADNFSHIIADEKCSVDPGVEYRDNPVSYKMTSDAFFAALAAGDVLSPDARFDVIFIDGLHLAEQVDRDIRNALQYITDDGFIVLHDCNPPTWWHAREDFFHCLTPARGYWNGTTWKAFMKWRGNVAVHSCCISSDWGVGILSKTRPIGAPLERGGQSNPFFEFDVLAQNRQQHLNLIDFEALKERVRGGVNRSGARLRFIVGRMLHALAFKTSCARARFAWCLFARAENNPRRVHRFSVIHR